MAASNAANAKTTSTSADSSAPTLLHQLESMMNNKDLENRALRRRVQILESILKSHGIDKVVPVDDKFSYPGVESVTTDTQTESESVSSLTNDPALDRPTPPKKGGKAATAHSKKPIGGTKQTKKDVIRKVSTVVEEDGKDDDDDDGDDSDDGFDDDATARTTATMNTFYTRRSLIMPPPDQQPLEPEPHPQGTQPGGRWYKQTSKGYRGPEPWSNSFGCSCSVKDVDPQDENYVYYDRKGTHKYFSPQGVQVASPIHSRGTSLSVVPHDGTIKAYFVKMGLPLYHQKQHTKIKAVRIAERTSSNTGGSSVTSDMIRLKTLSR